MKVLKERIHLTATSDGWTSTSQDSQTSSRSKRKASKLGGPKKKK